MIDGMRYFDILMRPEEIKLDTYLKVYDAFCKAYSIKTDETDRKRFSNEVNTNIYSKIKYGKSGEKGHEKLYVSSRHNVRAIDHRPQVGGNKLNAMLMVIPKEGYVRFHTHSYGTEKDYVGDFIKLANESMFKKIGQRVSIKTESIDD